MTLDVRLLHRRNGFALDAAFTAPAGVTVLFGRSGAGKTTVVNAVAGLLRPDAGRISVGDRVLLDTDAGVRLPPHRRRVGAIFQDARLFPHLTVRRNLLYGTPGRQSAEFARTVEMLGIGALLDRRPAGLSGGEAQRVAIGRALLSDPDLILADEPLAHLDRDRAAEILPYFERLRDETAVPILYVTHSVAEVGRLATTVVAMEAGRVTATGPAAEVLGDPAVTPVGSRGAGALLEAVVARHHADGLTELLAGDEPLFLPRAPVPEGGRVRVRIAAGEVILGTGTPGAVSALNVLSGTVERVRTGDGPGVLVSVRTGAGTLLARVTKRSADRLDLSPGRACHAIVKAVAIAREDVTGG